MSPPPGSKVKFRAQVEPPQPMKGLEVSPELTEAIGGGKRPRVTVTINGHSWKTRMAIMRGRYLIGLSNANRKAAGVATGDEVEVEVELDPEPPSVVEPADFARALDADPAARTAYDAWPTATDASTFTSSRAPTSLRPEHGESNKPWPSCELGPRHPDA